MGEGAEQADAVQQFLADNQARIADITRAFPPAAWAAQGMLGDAGALLRFLLTSLAAAGITVYGVGLVYRQLSLLPTAVGAAGKKAKGGRAYQALTALPGLLQAGNAPAAAGFALCDEQSAHGADARGDGRGVRYGL